MHRNREVWTDFCAVRKMWSMVVWQTRNEGESLPWLPPQVSGWQVASSTCARGTSVRKAGRSMPILIRRVSESRTLRVVAAVNAQLSSMAFRCLAGAEQP